MRWRRCARNWAARAGKAARSAACSVAAVGRWRWFAGFGGRRFWRRCGGRRRVRRRRRRQLPRLQSRPAAWRVFWIGSNSALNAEPFCSERPVAGAAGLGNQSLRDHLHERAVHSAPDQAQRQRYGLPDALSGHAQFQPAGRVRHRAHGRRARGDFSATGLPASTTRSTGAAVQPPTALPQRDSRRGLHRRLRCLQATALLQLLSRAQPEPAHRPTATTITC